MKQETETSPTTAKPRTEFGLPSSSFTFIAPKIPAKPVITELTARPKAESSLPTSSFTSLAPEMPAKPVNREPIRPPPTATTRKWAMPSAEHGGPISLGHATALKAGEGSKRGLTEAARNDFYGAVASTGKNDKLTAATSTSAPGRYMNVTERPLNMDAVAGG